MPDFHDDAKALAGCFRHVYIRLSGEDGDPCRICGEEVASPLHKEAGEPDAGQGTYAVALRILTPWRRQMANFHDDARALAYLIEKGVQGEGPGDLIVPACSVARLARRILATPHPPAAMPKVMCTHCASEDIEAVDTEHKGQQGYILVCRSCGKFRQWHPVSEDVPAAMPEAVRLAKAVGKLWDHALDLDVPIVLDATGSKLLDDATRLSNAILSSQGDRVAVPGTVRVLQELFAAFAGLRDHDVSGHGVKLCDESMDQIEAHLATMSTTPFEANPSKTGDRVAVREEWLAKAQLVLRAVKDAKRIVVDDGVHVREEYNDIGKIAAALLSDLGETHE